MDHQRSWYLYAKTIDGCITRFKGCGGNEVQQTNYLNLMINGMSEIYPTDRGS